MNKPLTKKDHDHTTWLLSLSQISHVLCNDAIKALMESEAYWREAVKSVAVQITDPACTFCGAPGLIVNKKPLMEHKSDCPWLLAQEPE